MRARLALAVACLIALVPVLAPHPRRAAASAPHFDIYFLEPSDPAGDSRAYAVDDANGVVGWVRAADGTRAAWWRWFGSDLRTWPALSGGTDSAAYGIAGSWQVGEADYSTTACPTGSIAAVFGGGAPVRGLDTLGGCNSSANAVNEDGFIVGWAEIPGGEWHAFVSDGSRRLQDISPPNASHSEAKDINAGGMVAGWGINPNGVTRGFIYSLRTGAYEHLGTLGGYDSQAFGINDNGHVVGTAELPDGFGHAFAYRNGDMEDLGTLGGPESLAFAINRPGDIVGVSNAPGGEEHAFLWSGGTMYDLNDLVPPGPCVLHMARDISDSGSIVGWGPCDDGHVRGFLLVPAGPEADLHLQMAAGPDPVAAGAQVTYTLTLSNIGPDTADSVMITDTLPPELSLVSCTATGGGVCGGTALDLTVSLASLAPGASATATLVAQVAAGIPDGTAITNTAAVMAATPDPGAWPNTAAATVQVANPADLAVSMTADRRSVKPNSNLTYTITVQNHGPGPAAGVTLQDPLPAGTTFVSATWSQGTCTAPPAGSGGTLSCHIDSLASGAGATLTLTVRIEAAAGKTVTNMAAAAATTPDPNPDNNSSTVTLRLGKK